MRPISPAEKAWIALGCYILAADVYLWRKNVETMSVQFEHWLQTPMGRLACVAGTATITAHLWWGLPLPAQKQLRHICTYNNNNKIKKEN